MNAALKHATNQRDATLVQHHRAGDPTAFADLYQTYHPQLLRFIRRRVREGHIAEDLTHDTFARALDRLGELRNPERFYPWLTVIARRLVINHYRDIGHVSAIADLDPGQSEAPDHQMLRRVEQDNVLEALNRVRDNYREVLRLREGEELSYRDIAQRLGITEALVTIWLHRARRALRREYLALTERERAPFGLAPLLGLAATIRRLRDRLHHFAGAMSDAAVAGSLATAAAIGVTMLLVPWPSGNLGSVSPERSTPPTAASSGAHRAVSPTDAERRNTASLAQLAAPPVGLGVPRYRPDTTVGETETRRARARDRHMPYYQEIGRLSIGADPEDMRRDLQSTLAGDNSWMEDR